MSPILDSIGSVKAYGWGSFSEHVQAFESIATVSVGGGGAANVEFTSIPGTYKHLQIRGISRSTKTPNADDDGILLTFNSDTGSNYAAHRLKGNGSSASSDGQVSGTYINIGIGARDGATSGIYGTIVTDILNYTDTNKYTTVRSLSGCEFNNTNGAVLLNSGLWMNTAAITSIKLSPEQNNFKQYSHFALYGIKGAA